MPRKLREEFDAGLYHVFARGNNRQRIYLDDADYRMYLNMLGSAVTRMRWSCLAYCLMDNHVHLLIETSVPNLAVGMQRLHGTYAQTFNARHGRCGHVFQGRYGAVRIERDEQLWSVVRYLARNPVEAGLCDRPEHWPWSSFRPVLEGSAPDWLDVVSLLGYLAAVGGEPRRRYAGLVAEMEPSPASQEPTASRGPPARRPSSRTRAA